VKKSLAQNLIRAAVISAALCSGMALGVLYAYRNPVKIQIQGTCKVEVPEFLIPSAT